MAGKDEKLELVIFDCDGVLVDSERIAVRIDAEVITKLGWPLTEADVVERFVGRSEAYQLAEIEAYLGRPLPPGWQAEFQHLYQDAFATELKPVDGLAEALEQISVPICVASSGTHQRIRYSLELTGLLPRFEGRIFSTEDVARGKPEPDLFLYAAERMRAEPGACAVVEDSRYGVEAAVAAGMRAFGYAGGLTAGDRLEAAGATVFRDMRELPGLLSSAYR